MINRALAILVSGFFCLSLVTGCASTAPVAAGDTNPESENESQQASSGVPKWVWWVGGAAIIAAAVAGGGSDDQCLFVTDSQGNIIPGGCDD